ncbi:MAG: hypothetical protein QOJ36_17 [Verrucomicrobiota bacterium]|jgi:hypothetical protein
MKTDQQSDPAVFLQTVSVAIGQLKQQLQHDYEQAYPDLREIIHLVLDEEETKSWELSLFPHLLLPDLVEAHVEKLNLQPAETKHDDVVAPNHFNQMPMYQAVHALCG